ncbi:threonine/serine ThrE exporter family protein [Brevibacterium pityocampae]|uniref:Threonine/serine exporter family protein n=1 Tax=Brevibacterium pityocampae TaxID=506594 RepID=A0ABP8J457_9MICO
MTNEDDDTQEIPVTAEPAADEPPVDPEADTPARGIPQVGAPRTSQGSTVTGGTPADDVDEAAAEAALDAAEAQLAAEAAESGASDEAAESGEPTTQTPAGGTTTATPNAGSPIPQPSEQPVAEPQTGAGGAAVESSADSVTASVAREAEDADGSGEPAGARGAEAAGGEETPPEFVEVAVDSAPRGSRPAESETPRSHDEKPVSRRAKKLIELTRPAGANSKRVAEKIARKAVGRIVTDNSPSTQPIPIIAALKGTPYQALVATVVKTEEEARMILDLAVDIGAIMLRAGAGSADVEVSVIATCTSLGLLDVEVDLTSNSLTVHYANPDGTFMTVMRVNREESIHFAKLASVHTLVSDMADGKIDYLEARERIDAIRRQRRPYGETFVTVAWGLLAGCFVLLLGGGYIASFLGFIMAIVNDRFGALLGRTGMPPFFTIAAQSMFTTLVAMTAWTFDLIAGPQYLVASGIVLLLPTLGLFSAVQDSLTKFPLTAASRTVEVFMSMAGIVSGIALGLRVGMLIGLSPIEIVVESGGVEALSTIISLIAASIVAACGSIGNQAARRIILPAAGVGLIGFFALTGLGVIGLGTIITSLIAATVVGFLCRPIALWRGAPAIVMLIPAIFPLLQGLSIFSAVYEIVQPQDAMPLSAGLSSLFTAVTANAALAVGAVLGNFLARPLGMHKRRSEPPVDPAPAA